MPVIPDWFGPLLMLGLLTLGVVIANSLWQRSRSNQVPRARTNHLRFTRPTSRSVTHDAQDPREVWNRLTRREKEIARLASGKMTDGEIAKTLSISEKTVGNHLYNLYGKLEINSRRELKYILQHLEDDS